MLNLSNENIIKIKECYNDLDVEQSANNIIKVFSNGKEFSMFTLFKLLNTLVILHDDKGDNITRYITTKINEKSNYLILSADRSVEEMRFDAACMLRRFLKAIGGNKKTASINACYSNNFSREDKHFACALLMPRDELVSFIMQKDENGKYIYLNDDLTLTLKNINIIADHFGVPYSKCCSRIYYVFENLRDTRAGNFYIENCHDRKKYKESKKTYMEINMEKDLKELVPNYENNQKKRKEHLIDSLHYRSYSKLSDIAKRRILVNLAKFDSVNEKVVKSEDEATDIIYNYIASGGSVYDGKLITKNGEVELSDEQLVVITEYELYTKAMERGLIRGIAKNNPRLKYIENLEYKEALDCLNEKDIADYICGLHGRLFAGLSNKYGEPRGGFYRTGVVNLAGTDVKTAEPRMIKQLMENVCWRILKILKENADGKYSNSEYIDSINECIYEIIRMQPFADGNKRTARLLQNILYQEKGIPFVLLQPKEWNNYVDAWSYENTSKYNDLMHRLIIESYSYFYGDQSVEEATNNKEKTEKIIYANRKIRC